GHTATSLAIAVGNTLEGLLGCYLVNQLARGRHAFERPQDVIKFALLAAVLSTMVSATVGVTSLCLAGIADWADYQAIWFTWWLGDAVGDIVVAPMLVLWSVPSAWQWRRGQIGEAALLLLSLLLIGVTVFGERFHGTPLEFLCAPLLIWAAFRFGPRGA